MQTSKRVPLFDGNTTSALSQNGPLSIKNFTKLRVIGRGAHGLCSLYRDNTCKPNKKVVIKMVSLECRSDAEKRAILCELNAREELFKLGQ